MSIVRQESLFSMQILFDLEEPTKRTMELFQRLTSSQSFVLLRKGRRPVKLNCPAIIQSLTARIVERIPEIYLLVERLNKDLMFKYDCGFLISDPVPSEASLRNDRSQ